MKKIPKRRRIENKTDYKLRLGLLKSKVPRIVIRRTNRYIIVQLVETQEGKDIIKKGCTSKELLNQGWDEKFKGSLKSISAAYLTGLLMAKKIEKGEYILDIGIAKHKAGSRIYAVAKGLSDGGLKIRADPSIFPPEERLSGKHLKENVSATIQKLKSKLK
ncbi:MAG: 50S ribosomal protein L18 [Nanoarchaeota archaeon]